MPDYSEIVGAASGVDRRVRFWENERPPMEQCGMKTYSLFSTWLRVAATYAGVALSLLVLAPLALPESPPPLLGRFIFTGDFNTARAFHTATLLRYGSVLAAGGYTDSASRSAELYDPRSRTWTPTGDLITARNAHTATLLLDGKVLVAGGSRTNAAPIREAELYDPATGTWTSAGNLRQARTSHTATLLEDGRVLVVGGTRDYSDGLASTEIYDPATGIWSATANLNEGRWTHTASLLPDGTVIVAGGRRKSDHAGQQRNFSS